VADAAW
jgi:hypothetical protein